MKFRIGYNAFKKKKIFLPLYEECGSVILIQTLTLTDCKDVYQPFCVLHYPSRSFSATEVSICMISLQHREKGHCM